MPINCPELLEYLRSVRAMFRSDRQLQYSLHHIQHDLHCCYRHIILIHVLWTDTLILEIKLSIVFGSHETKPARSIKSRSAMPADYQIRARDLKFRFKSCLFNLTPFLQAAKGVLFSHYYANTFCTKCGRLQAVGPFVKFIFCFSSS